MLLPHCLQLTGRMRALFCVYLSSLVFCLLMRLMLKCSFGEQRECLKLNSSLHAGCESVYTYFIFYCYYFLYMYALLAFATFIVWQHRLLIMPDMTFHGKHFVWEANETKNSKNVDEGDKQGNLESRRKHFLGIKTERKIDGGLC